MTETIAEIWNGDLLERKAEAELLIGYIESVTAQPQTREDAQGFTIAVDAGYGEGKTWFLKRLAKQLALNHPVAFVDAWKDDLADEPLTALVATLKKALDPLIEKQPAINEKFKTVVAKTGAVSKIVAKGLLKTAAKLAITKEGVEAIDAVFDDGAELLQGALADVTTDAASSLTDEAFSGISANALMEQRIADFEAGQRAMEELRESLKALVASLRGVDLHAPVIIIIDELDRCRPTYAVKLLEEVKHLFDVPGFVFIFGMHKGQLAHSVKAAYGSDFDGKAYLGRFMQRHYRMASASLVSIVRNQIEGLGIVTNKLWFPYRSGHQHTTLSEIIAFYLSRYGMGARDAISVMGSLHICCALTARVELFMPLLLPMIISKLLGSDKGLIAEPKNADENLMFRVDSVRNAESITLDWRTLAKQLHAMTYLSDIQMAENQESDPANSALQLFAEFRNDATRANIPLANPSNYAGLIDAVGRFSLPGSATPQQ